MYIWVCMFVCVCICVWIHVWFMYLGREGYVDTEASRYRDIHAYKPPACWERERERKREMESIPCKRPRILIYYACTYDMLLIFIYLPHTHTHTNTRRNWSYPTQRLNDMGRYICPWICPFIWVYQLYIYLFWVSLFMHTFFNPSICLRMYAGNHIYIYVWI